MRVIVTGGAGFIGSHIVDQLLRLGHDAFVIDDLTSGSKANLPGDVPVYEVDIRNREAVKQVFDEVRPQLVSHQAAQMSVSRSVREPVFDAEVNALGMLHVLENCVRHEVGRVSFASSGGVLYGDVDTPVPEETPAAPISPYGITKFIGEQYLQFFAREHGLKSVALRYTNVYGPRQNPHGEAGVVAIFCKAMLAGNPSTIFGDGGCVRDYVFCQDVARANVLALTTDLEEPFSAFNISTEVGTDVNQLAGQIHSLVEAKQKAEGIDSPNVPKPSHGPERAGDLRSNLAGHSKATRVLGWKPEVDLRTGLEQTVAWFAEQRKTTGNAV